MLLSTADFRRPTPGQMVLLGLILFCCTVDSSRQISIAGVSGLGAATLAAGGIVWAAWLVRPVLPPNLLVIVLPLICFQMDALGTLFWYRPHAMDGVQLATVGLTFLGVLMLACRESDADPRLAPRLHKLILFSSALPVFAWILIILSHRIVGDDLNLSRPFALYSLIVVAVALASWISNFRPAMARGRFQPRHWLPVIWAVIVAYAVFLGLSRTALVGILMMFPLAVALRGNFASVLLAGLTLAAGAGAFYLILTTNQGLYDRFFHEDAHMQVGGMAINGSGRTQIWKLLLDTINDDWIFGKGISASEDIINRSFSKVGQPHNDYLRFYYDQGVVGLALWLVFVAGFVYRTCRSLRRSIRFRTDDYPIHLAALLATAGVAFSMLTDNSVCYTFVMVPLAIVIGSSLGTGARANRRSIPDIPPQPFGFPLPMKQA